MLEVNALYQGKNPRGMKFVAEESGDPGTYQELRVGAFLPDGNCLADVLLTLDKKGQVRVFITTEGGGDGDHELCIYPEKPTSEAVEYCRYESE